ncbi:MAG: hypothetical protein V3T72_15780, partial [Thermoanaerobaculia bacterium]
MSRTAPIDCIVVGYHDIDFQGYVNTQKKMAEFNGGYRDAKHNSVLLDGRRLNFNQLLNWSIRKGTGRDPNLNIFEVPSLATTYLTSFLRRRGFNAQIVGFFN